ncbi:glycosyltransferase family 9 protein [Maridesulfovibrio hydrothermalis]|uniref:Glycosyl transferase family 9 n=1 Tax=Maridesulfovibrio hydrothermalis AM13 = DSM 14728 TaxID=1121451 RepID=L0RG69_9BACT|nr:glycosyltransferase family 9 protein [Maridesulfovibrio hydrothermalis]CCO24556.1 Glycosyl transferase family 9 [Maridesulfovibrio hydrothermalis AM13 = DSM 14728]
MKRVLIIQLTRFGDLVQTKRLVLTLEQRGFEVHLCIDQSLKDLAALLYPDCIIHPIIAHGTAIKGRGFDSTLPVNLKIFRKFSKFDFSEIYNLNYSPMNYALSALFDPAKVKGHRLVNGQAMKSRWFDFTFRLAAERRNNINLVDYWAALSPDMIAPSEVNPSACPAGEGIGVVLAGRESRRSLPVEVLAPLVLSVRSTKKCKKIFLLGSRSEHESGRKLLAKLPPAVAADTVNLAGKTDWQGLLNTVSKLDLLMTPDTGTMHLAAHLGIPVMGLFLSSAWCTETGPYGLGHTIIQADSDCSPCTESQPCYNDLKCLNPFKDSSLMRFIVTGKPEHLPPGLSVFDSTCDFLGTDFKLKAGHDITGERRNRIRHFIGCHLGLLDIGKYGPFKDLAEKFYKEKDWITA